MRTDQEIIARAEAVEKRDWLGFEKGVLVSTLTFEAAKPFLKKDADPANWGEPNGRDREAVLAEMLDYMDFAWDKANNCRGISAGRSISYMSAWLWLIGYDEGAEQIRDYTHYGKPQLRAICEHFGWDWRKWDDGEWKNEELEDGLATPESVEALQVPA